MALVVGEAETKIDAYEKLLRDIEGVLLGYWTDIPQSEIQRLLSAIQATYAPTP